MMMMMMMMMNKKVESNSEICAVDLFVMVCEKQQTVREEDQGPKALLCDLTFKLASYALRDSFEWKAHPDRNICSG
jgi:hypothetical protein